jgi:uncharacterized protein (TIGR03118 family)
MNKTPVVRPALVLALASITLAHCGGGGGSGSGYGGTSGGTSAPQPAPTNTGYTFKSLVADHSGTSATIVDPNLVNPWGIVFAPASPVWTANNGTNNGAGTSTLYDGNGVRQSLVVTMPMGANGNFNPTGIVYNGTIAEFGGDSFIYCGEGGMISGWTQGTVAVIKYTDASGADHAVYKGLAFANNGTADHLYAADFHNNKVDVFDTSYTLQPSTGFPFSDPALPAGYAPFNIQAIKNGAGGTWQLYVAYAQQAAPDNHDNNNGAGLGLVDIFDANGTFVKRLISTGAQLNAPWGIALAPSDFGALSGKVLVGNFGDGQINAFEPATGAFVSALNDGTGHAFSVPGLWGIAFGNDSSNQSHNTLYYAAGTNDEANGDYGRIDVNASGATPPSQPPGY